MWEQCKLELIVEETLCQLIFKNEKAEKYLDIVNENVNSAFFHSLKPTASIN